MKKYIKMVKKEIFLYLVFGAVSYGFSGLMPYFMKTMFEEKFLYSLIGYSVCLIGYILFSYFTNLSQVVYKNKFDIKVKEDYFNKAFSLREEAFKEQNVGAYISFQVNEITEIGENYLNPLVGIYCQVIRMILFFLIIFWVLGLKMTLILIITTILSMLLPKSLSKETAARRVEYLKEQKKYYSVVEELYQGHNISNNRTIPNIIKMHSKLLYSVLKKRIYYGRTNSLMWTINGLSVECINYVALIYLGYLLYKGNITAAYAIAAFQYTRSLMEPVEEIAYNKSLLHSMDEIIQEFIDFISADAKSNNSDNNICVGKSKESDKLINIQNVTIEYNSFKLDSISLTLEKNKKYAVIGKNGSGKSSLFRLLASQIDNYNGEVYLEGENIRNKDLSKYIGVLNQEEYVFSTDYHSNITLFDSYCKSDNNPFHKYNISINNCEDCSLLSGGEKNLINLERLLNKEVDILLLDEPLAAVDDKKKNELLDTILSINSTVFMITHDIGESLAKFDAVLFLEDGKLLYNLPYAELVDKNEYKQFRNTLM